MRNLFLFPLLLGFLLAFTSCGEDNAASVQPPLASVVEELPPNATLEGIEAKITKATNESFFNVDAAPLARLHEEINAVATPGYDRLVAYWSAYNDFQTAIFHMKNEEPAESERTVRRGIDALAAIEGKNAEELTLQAFLQGFAIQFNTGMATARAANEAMASIEAARELNPDNLRTQYVLGSLDFYTPAEYGGGKKAEGFLVKAIDLPVQTVASSYLPSWGKAEAYELLVRHYKAAADEAVASRYLKEGLSQYPDNYQLSALNTAGE
ncbi:hypothetical protein FUA23_18670 [Neolewinella aurantiaca]|uniref:Uncharacterized protein n=1 Tax=Neolewinella aurantiaca TaxID=2602767 RepID=A0A5C7FIH6_9BACT|nr:hypothetical protein [Neolewinella aurantiaca]TXF87117.1 hypothetical protein FUA23_18670 [Neolewinella aurantiaca]